MEPTIAFRLSDVLHVNAVAAIGLAFACYSLYSLLALHSDETSRFFRFVGIGWSFDVLALAWMDFSRRLQLPPLESVDLPLLLLNNINSVAFLVAATQLDPEHWLARTARMRLVYVGLVTIPVAEFLLWRSLSIASVLSGFVAAGSVAAVLLGYVHLLRSSEDRQPAFRRLLLGGPLIVFSVLQVVALWPDDIADAEFPGLRSVDAIFYAIGAACKAVHLIGLMVFMKGMLAKYRRALQDLAEHHQVFDRARTIVSFVDQVNHETQSALLALRLRAQAAGATTDANARQDESTLAALVEQVAAPLGALTDVLQPDRHGRPSELAVVSLNNVCDAVAIQLKQLHAFRTKIVKHYSSSVSVRCAQAEIFQVLRNVVKNALEATEGHGTAVVITTERTNGTCRVLISDDGPGVPKELRDDIFRQGVSTKGGHGRGQGLYVARQLARQNQGSLTLLDRPQPGACFELLLPSYASESLQ